MATKKGALETGNGKRHQLRPRGPLLTSDLEALRGTRCSSTTGARGRPHASRSQKPVLLQHDADGSESESHEAMAAPITGVALPAFLGDGSTPASVAATHERHAHWTQMHR